MKEKYQKGQRVGELTLIEKIPYRIPSGKAKVKWKCACSCGKETVVFASNLNKTKSCGHLSVDALSKAGLQNKTGMRFGRLTVIERADDRIGKSGRKIVQWLCLCDCGKYTKVDSAELNKGTIISCGCFQKENNGKSLLKTHVGDRYGKLTVIEKMPSLHYGRSTMTRWKCKCDCGSICFVFGGSLRRGQVSCGCINSKAEEEIANILSSKNICFYRQYYFEDLLSEKNFPLHFDFAIMYDNKLLCLIEYQGVQHYVAQANHFGDYQRQVTDGLKKEYCKAHGIKLFEIKYSENISEAINCILNRINANTVPNVKIHGGVTTIP